MNGKPQPNRTFSWGGGGGEGGVGMLWKININNIKQTYLRLHPGPCCKPSSVQTHICLAFKY